MDRLSLVALFAAMLSLFCPGSPTGDLQAADAPAESNGAGARFVVTDEVLRPAAKVPPLGANNWGECGAVMWAANNFVRNSGNEPVYWRNMHRVQQCGDHWFEIDGPGTSWWDLWASGFLSGADLRIYRLVDKSGQPLPEADGYLDIRQADHVERVGTTTILPEGSPGFPDGGWIANMYSSPYPNNWIRHGNLRTTDAAGLENGRTYWYTVVAIDARGQESPMSDEVSATPKAGQNPAPHILISGNDDKLPSLQAGGGFEFTPKVFGGEAPYRWEVVGQLPDGLELDSATGTIRGAARKPVENFRFDLKVTDARNQSDTRSYTINPPASGQQGAGGDSNSAPQPPRQLQATAGDGCVTLSWEASATAGVVAYRLQRSTAPKSEQMQRVYVSADAPKLRRWDYVVLQKRFDRFDMKYVNPRVRGIGNPFDAPSWYWDSDPKGVSFSFAPHPQPVPSEMADPGETCMQIDAVAGTQRIFQTVFIGTQHEGESIWYGQLEPGKQYRLEVWLRQQGLADDGAVTFSYNRAYPGITTTFHVDDPWKKYVYEFTGPQRPTDAWHFGHNFSFCGPGTLWMDNCRIFRVDRPADIAAPYVPNATVFDELMASQPAEGTKAAHRIWFLTRDATMNSILSWHASSRVRLDWCTTVEGTLNMTLPMGLTFDLATGESPKTRMRPWLVLQHVLHDEQDWKNLVEYLGAPYDPRHDTPASKPWAYRRYQQRGVGTPWTDEFEEILIEFGNETWHNGHFEDWLGFGRFNAIWQGGTEYGLFCQYLIDTMKASPYWQSEKLAGKIRFCLGAGYNGSVESDGRVVGYGEEAMQTCPDATALGHANYVGPKWETGDASGKTFDDHGVQATLLGFLAGPEESQIRMKQARNELAKRQRAYDIMAYEGGPSGYALPGRDSPEEKLVNEKYGKSLAMAVASLDAWMRSYAYGWTEQCFLGYGQGMYWNSHTPLWDGFRPSPAWQALAMRNRYAAGDMMRVVHEQVPTIPWDGQRQPLAGAYAMRDGERWSVFVVSRVLDGNHDGKDFGDGQTPVTLRLPFASAEKITLHALAGDPRASNREQLAIAPQTQTIPAAALRDGVFSIGPPTGGSAHGMPPGSIFLYVFEGTTRP